MIHVALSSFVPFPIIQADPTVAVAVVHSLVVAVLAGGEVQVHIATYGWLAVTGASPTTVCALTNTGMIAPVFKLKTRCPRTLNIDAISPE